MGQRRRAQDQTGASAVEYGLMIALIAAAIVAIVIILGGTTSDAYDSMNGTFW